MRFTLALLAAATAVMAQGPISQISDGQIQNPTTPIVVYSTAVPSYPAGNSSVVVVGTGSSSAAAAPTGIYSNSTASAGSSAASVAGPTGSSTPASSSKAPESTGGAVANQVGGFGVAAAIAALILA